MQSDNSTVAALERQGYKLVSVIEARDIRRLKMVSASSGPALVVFETASAPNLFEVEHECALPCESLDAELELRRALDVDAQNFVFVKTSVDVMLGNATVKLGATHELPVGAAERRSLADFYAAHLLGALGEWSLCNLGEIVEAA